MKRMAVVSVFLLSCAGGLEDEPEEIVPAVESSATRVDYDRDVTGPTACAPQIEEIVVDGELVTVEVPVACQPLDRETGDPPPDEAEDDSVADPGPWE